MPPKPFVLAVKAFIDNGRGQYLLIRRSRAAREYAGEWDLPGGKVDVGEPFDAALAREIAEETGLDVSLRGVAGATEYELPEIRLAVLFMLARLAPDSGEVRLSEEHDAHQWVIPEELRKTEFPDELRSFVRNGARFL